MKPERKPILCYVTDRRGVTAAPGSAESTSAPRASTDAFDALRGAIRRAATAGATWIQIREKDLDAGLLLNLTRSAMAAIRGKETRVIVNDRLDVALTANAAGVHLGENSLPLASVVEWRRSAGRPDFLVGVSCHSLESARAAASGGADYIFFGPVFVTPSKAAFGAPQGIERLREACSAVGIPVLAIGGIDLQNARECLAAGAAGIAAIRLFQDGSEARDLLAGIL